MPCLPPDSHYHMSSMKDSSLRHTRRKRSWRSRVWGLRCANLSFLGISCTKIFPQDDVAPPSVPLFALEKVQYALPAPLLAVVVSSDTLVMGLASNAIVIIELSREERVIQIPIPRKTTEMTIYKLFLDPSGRHLIISSLQGENWYLFKGWKKPRLLKSFKMVIESVAWNKSALLGASHSTSTREMLIGARNGTLYEAVLDAEDDFFKSQERFLQPVFTLPERHPVTGVKFDFFPPMDGKRVLIVVTTPSRIYQFTGGVERRSEEGSRTFASVFSSYRDSAPSMWSMFTSICMLIDRRDFGVTWEHRPIRIAYFQSQRRPSLFSSQRHCLDDRSVTAEH